MSAIKRNEAHFGLPVYTVRSGAYAVGTEKQAQTAAALAIEDRLWSFSAEFLVLFFLRHNPFLRDLSDEATEALQDALEQMQAELADDVDPLIRALVGNSMPALVEHVITTMGRGFLASHDGQERRSDTIEGLPNGRRAYRLT